GLGYRGRFAEAAGFLGRCRSDAVAATTGGNCVERAGVNGGFLRGGCGQGTEVIGGFQAAEPGHTVGDVQLLAVGTCDIQVEALGLVDPLLATAGGFHNPARFDFKRGGIDGFQVGRDAVDLLHRTFVVLEVVDHHAVPQAAFFQVVYQVRVDHGELAG